MQVFPVNFSLVARKALVAGSGKVALDKVQLLLDAGAVTAKSALGSLWRLSPWLKEWKRRAKAKIPTTRLPR
jgi:siroheme synthase (precorrin-2 oxidase/ferrochelatase)